MFIGSSATSKAEHANVVGRFKYLTRERRQRIVDAAAARGSSLIDTADVDREWETQVNIEKIELEAKKMKDRRDAMDRLQSHNWW